MSETNPSPKTTVWILALIVSIALNGLLVGLLMSAKVAPKPFLADKPPVRTQPAMADFEHPQKLLRHLEPARRRQIMAKAMKNMRESNQPPPHVLMKELRQARKQTLMLLKSPDLDENAFREQLSKARQIKEQLGRQGDMLVLEIFKQLTPDERKRIRRARQQDKRKAQQKPKN